MVRGLAADVAWRGRHVKAAAHPSTLEEAMKTSKALYRSALRVALGVAAILSLPLVAMQFTDEVVWSLADFVLAGVLLATMGVALELAVRKAGNLVTALGIAVLGVAAGLLGQADDAPGLVLLGLLLIGSACALGVRTAQRSS
jgi:peptidoglycan/LPS O-acetylase OafA/YrhL